MKSIFISGGADGIGWATARLFAGRGWRVGTGDLKAPATQEPDIGFYPLDDRGLDVLVNNAGIVRHGHFEDTAPEAISDR